MTTRRNNTLLGPLRRALLLRDAAGMSDGQLLGYFLSRRDEAAFEVLVRRHGPMVLGVCRRVLGDLHDAEDAFQATFLVLARKAATVVPRELVGNWLYGVAYRTACKARTAAVRRRARERQVSAMPDRAAPVEALWQDLQPLLDRELARLPEKYRVPVVLCDLQGRPRKEVAAQLGWPEGTLSGRLARARQLLARRLAPHGLTLAGGALAGLLTANAACGAVPAPLVISTVQAAALTAAGQAAMGLVSAHTAALTEGVVRAMFLTKLKIATGVCLLIAVAGAGTGGVALQARAHDPAPAKEAPRKSEQEPPAKNHLGYYPVAELLVRIRREQLDDQAKRLQAELEAQLARAEKQRRDSEEQVRALREHAEVILQKAVQQEKVLREQVRAIEVLAELLKAELERRGTEIDGVLQGVDVARNTVTITLRGTKLKLEAVPIAADARFYLGDKECGINDLKQGMAVSLKVATDRTSKVVTIRGPRAEKE